MEIQCISCSAPGTPQHTFSTLPSQLHSPSLTTPPVSSPVAQGKTLETSGGSRDEIGRSLEINMIDAWLPVTESRNGNAYYAAFHTLSAGVGIQALLLPVAFVNLGWIWGTLWLASAFIWQLYTLWLLTQLHEPATGIRYSRYLHLSIAAYGEKLGKRITMFPIVYLSGGTCTVLIIVGGGSMKLFSEVVCGSAFKFPLSTIEWYLIFVCLTSMLTQLPNLNSLAVVSLLGAMATVSYCTTIWIISLSHESDAIIYKPITASNTESILKITNGLGIIAFVFRGHNLTLEIQGTMPSSPKHPSRIPMWWGIKIAYTLVAACLFPIAVGGYWAYGDLISTSEMLIVMYRFHLEETSKIVLGMVLLFVAISCLSSFQIYAMAIFDDVEYAYVKKHNKPCPRWLRSGFRISFVFFSLCIAVAFPFLSRLAGILGAFSLPVTLAYPCFMWILMKKPKRYSSMWFINWMLGCLGIVISILLVIGEVWSAATTGLKLKFFKI